MITKLDHPPYTIDPNVHARFDERKTILARRSWEASADFYGQPLHQNAPHVIATNRRGYSRLEYARLRAAWTVHDHFGGAFAWDALDAPDPVAQELGRYRPESPAQISAQVKETARMYGAALVGICELDRRWVYSHDREGNPIDIPPEYRYAVVMAIAMDAEAILRSPTYPAAVATGIGYSRMAFATGCLAEFIRSLGYKAIPMGNDTSLSIPLAIDAGLGELGRSGLLVTPQYGPCVRLCKVFTDLPLEPDPPIEFGITRFCKACNRCSGNCPADAISTEREPSYQVACRSNNHGILRWAVNVEKCYSFWLENGASCANCMRMCPFTRRALRAS
ncbi:MAG: reductive dehalogenase [Anaerolineae bacterium]|nr:reductive dehalogenase [Anaerolineae bacterium]